MYIDKLATHAMAIASWSYLTHQNSQLLVHFISLEHVFTLWFCQFNS